MDVVVKNGSHTSWVSRVQLPGSRSCGEHLSVCSLRTSSATLIHLPISGAGPVIVILFPDEKTKAQMAIYVYFRSPGGAPETKCHCARSKL